MKISSLDGVFEDKKPNHVLVNEYTPGQGIMVRFVCGTIKFRFLPRPSAAHSIPFQMFQCYTLEGGRA